MTVELLRRHRLSVEDFHRMAEAGILGPDDRVELIEGELIDMVPIGTRHAACIRALVQALTGLDRAEGLLGVQNPVRLGDSTEPQPDVMILRPHAGNYGDAHPTPADVLLLIEVSDTTLAYDRERKVPLYARHGVPEVWLIDLEASAVAVYREPGLDGYAVVSRHGPGDTLQPLLLPRASFRVADLLP